MLPQVRGQGQQLRVPGWDGAGTAERSYPSLRSGAAAGRSYPPRPRPGVTAKRSHPVSEVRGGGLEEAPRAQGRGSGWEEQPQVQGAVAAWAQEGLEEPSHVEGQEGRQ